MIDLVIWHPSPITITLLALILASLSMIGVRVAQEPALFSQPGACVIALESVSVLVAYAVAGVWIGGRQGTNWEAIVRCATLFGLFGGTLETLNIAIENGVPFAIHNPALSIGYSQTWNVPKPRPSIRSQPRLLADVRISRTTPASALPSFAC